MVQTIKRLVLALFPELAAKHHLPMLAKVVAIQDPPTIGASVDDYRPHYAVDLQLLNDDMTPNTQAPIYKAVPLPLNPTWHFPQPGTVVEFAFAYGNPARPFVRAILSHGQALPELDRLAQRWCHDSGAQLSMDAGGNIERHSPGHVQDQALTHTQTNQASYLNTTIKQDTITGTEHSSITGSSTKEVGGALQLLAKEKLAMASLKDLQLATDTTLDALAKELISLKTDGKVWVGSDSTNVVKVLLDLVGVVKALAKATAEHTHKGKTVPAPDNAADFTQQESQAGALSSELSPLTP